MSFLRILPAFALIACGSAEKEDDTSSFEPTSEPTSEPASAPTNETGPTTFDIDFLGAYAFVNVENSTEIAAAASVNTDNGPAPLDNTFFIVMAFENWDGTIQDGDNACILQYTLEGGTVDDDFFTDANVTGGWVGWNFSGADNFAQESTGCASLSEGFVALYEGFKTSDFGLGMAPLTSDMQSALQGEPGSQNYTSDEDWASDFAPYFYSQYVKLNSDAFQGGSSGWSPVNFAVAYEVGEDGVLSETTNDAGDTINVRVDITDATFAPDAFHYGTLAFGWGFGG